MNMLLSVLVYILRNLQTPHEAVLFVKVWSLDWNSAILSFHECLQKSFGISFLKGQMTFGFKHCIASPTVPK